MPRLVPFAFLPCARPADGGHAQSKTRWSLAASPRSGSAALQGKAHRERRQSLLRGMQYRLASETRRLGHGAHEGGVERARAATVLCSASLPLAHG